MFRIENIAHKKKSWTHYWLHAIQRIKTIVWLGLI